VFIVEVILALRIFLREQQICYLMKLLAGYNNVSPLKILNEYFVHILFIFLDKL